jgi:CheY-like chemotaxis protein
MICRHLVELMGGAIQVHSQINVGSTFAFTIRATAARPEDIAPAVGLGLPAAQATHRLLVVDDNLTNLQVASAMLTRLGYPHDTRDNGLRAIEAVEQAQREHRPYALVLLDSHMPEIDGVDTVRQIRERLGDSAPVVVGVSASSLARDRARCLEAGMADYLTKPLELQVLGQALRRWLPAAVAQDGSPIDDTATAAPWIDSARWAVLGDVDGGTGAVRREIAQGFLAALDQRLADIRRAASASSPPEALFQAAHQLKGAALNVGALRLARLCEPLEAHTGTTVRSADIDAIVAAVQATRQALPDA